MRISLLAAVGLAVVCGVFLLVYHPHVPPPATVAMVPDPTGLTNDPRISPPHSQAVQNLRLRGALRVIEMTDAQKAELARKYNEEFKPAFTKWCKAYTGHVWIRPEDLTLDKFNSVLGGHQFSFTIDQDTTLTMCDARILDGKRHPAYVMSLTSRQTALPLVPIPTAGGPSNLLLPVTADEVIAMIQADCGIKFQRSEVVIQPSGRLSPLGNGARVGVLPVGADPNNVLAYPLTIAFDPDGKISTYERM